MANSSKKFDAILFDLDGTLLDTQADIAKSMNAALAQFGFPTHPVDSYRYFIGKGLDCLVRRTLPKEHISDETISKCLIALEEQYNKHWADNTEPYPGIPELLSNLQQRNIPKVVLSNKPDYFTGLIVGKLLSDWSFDVVHGSKPSVPKKPDPTAALLIAEELQISPNRFVYLGDTDIDMQTAVSAGMYPAGALWGFGDAEQLLVNGTKTLVQTPEQVLTLFDK